MSLKGKVLRLRLNALLNQLILRPVCEDNTTIETLSMPGKVLQNLCTCYVPIPFDSEGSLSCSTCYDMMSDNAISFEKGQFRSPIDYILKKGWHIQHP